MRTEGLWRWALVLTTIALTVGVWRAGAQGGATLDPPVVALVNLEKVVNQLDELRVQEDTLEHVVQQEQDKLDDLQRRRREKVAELEVVPQNSAQAKALRVDILRIDSEAKFQTQLSEAIIDNRRAEIYKTMFDKSTAAIERLAAQRGFDLVLSNDADSEVVIANAAGVQRQMALRRVLHYAAPLDVTVELVALMNNEWNAGGGAP